MQKSFPTRETRCRGPLESEEVIWLEMSEEVGKIVEGGGKMKSKDIKQEEIIKGAHLIFHQLRYRIVEALRKHPNGMYINELAKEMRKDRRLVSFHLLMLLRDGLVEGEYEIIDLPKSKGKAIKRYKLTEKTERILEGLEKILEKL
jgi:DNA-binding transcriptional ArsR family regulator